MQQIPRSDIQIIPAILAEDRETFFALTEKALSFANRIQFDFMDGLFVPSKSVDIGVLEEVRERFGFEGKHLEAHLMICEPEKHAPILSRAGVNTFIFHFEAVEKPEKAIRYLREFGFEVGLAINPETRIEDFEQLVESVDLVMFMTVKPGFYGSPLEVEVLKKVQVFSKKYPDIVTAVDGGVKVENLDLFLDAGARRICVGSAIMKAEDPVKAYNAFIKKIKEKVAEHGLSS